MISKKAALIGTLALVALSLPMGAMAANKLIVKDAAGASDVMVVTDTGRIGLNNSAPLAGLHMTGQLLQDAQVYLAHNPAVGTNGGGGGIVMSYNNNGGLPANGDRLGYIYFGSIDGANRRNVAGMKAIADGVWTTNVSTPTAFVFETSAPNNPGVRTERMRINSAGYVGIGTTAPKSALHVTGLPVFPDNTTAIAGGLTAGAFYRTDTGVLMVAF